MGMKEWRRNGRIEIVECASNWKKNGIVERKSGIGYKWKRNEIDKIY